MFGMQMGKMGGVGQMTLAQRIAYMFANSEPGAWYDPSDLTTLFQDSAGTTPVTAVEQPVGLMLDLSGNGNHASQATTTKRGVVSRRVNLLRVKSEEITSGGTLLSFIAGSVVDRYGVAVRKAVPNTDTNVHLYPITVYKPAGKYRIRFEAKAGEYSFVTYQGRSNEGAWKSATFNLGTGLVQNNTGAVSAVMSPLGYGWYLCEAVFENTTNTAGLENDGIFIGSNATNWQGFAGDGSSGLHFTRCEIVTEESWHLPYQRVNTPTDYDADPNKFPTYIRLDGVDDTYQTNSIDFSGTDKMTVWAGITRSAQAIEKICELSTSVSNNSVFSLGLSSGNFSAFISRGVGGGYPNAYAPLSPAPVSAIIGGAGAINDKISTARANGVSVNSNVDQGTGNYGNYPLYIGASAGTSLFFNGRLYSLIVRGAQSSQSQIEATDLYVKQKMRLP